MPTLDGERVIAASQFFDDPIGPALRDTVFWMEDGHCAKCRCRLSPSPGLSTSFHVDHIVPQSWGSADHSIANLQPLCRKCNTVKGATEDIDYRSDEARRGLRPGRSDSDFGQRLPGTSGAGNQGSSSSEPRKTWSTPPSLGGLKKFAHSLM